MLRPHGNAGPLPPSQAGPQCFCLSPICILAIIILWSLAGQADGLHLAPECTKYKPKSCALVHDGDSLPDLLCHTGDGTGSKCAFDTSELRECPLPDTGSFEEHKVGTRREGLQCLGNDHEHATLPSCGHACCAGDLHGAFRPEPRRHTHHRPRFKPQNDSCTFHDYSWRLVEQCLAGSRVLIAGDSIMRQFFNQGVSLFRGHDVALDYNKHAHARYRVCRKADSLAFGSFQPQRWEIPLEEVQALYGPSANISDFPACAGEPIVEVDYLWAPRHMDLVPTLTEFDASIAQHSSRSQLVYITFAGFWEDQSKVPEDYLQMLDVIRGRAKMLIIMGVPLARVYNEKKDNTDMRNKQMSAWAASRSEAKEGNVLFLDFGHLSTADHAPQGIGSMNWHYQCFLDHNHIQEAKAAVGSLDRVWHWQEAPDHLYPNIWTDDDGRCLDEMDITLWHVVLNMICNKRS